MSPVSTELIPSTEELRAAYDGPDAMLGRDVVTVMMRHLPRTYTLKELAEEIESVVPSYAYNYIHLPWDHRRGSNITYVFVNFTSPEWAMRTFLLLSGRSWTLVQSPKICRIAAAFLQGLGPNLANYALNCGIQAESSNAPAVFTCDRKRMDLQLAVNTFCTPGDFQMAREQALRTQGGAAARATSMKASAEAADVEFKRATEMLTKNVDTNKSCKMLMKDGKDDQVTAHGCNYRTSSSSCCYTQKSELQQHQQILRVCASTDLLPTASATADQSLSDQEFDPAGEGPNPALAGNSQGQDQHPRGLFFITETTEHRAAHNQTLSMLKAAGFLSHESVQRTASHGTWSVPPQHANGSLHVDTDSDQLLASIKFFAVDV